MKRAFAPAVVLVALATLAACSRESERDFARYYDELGLFTLNLPAANDITVTPPQPAANGPGILTGVLSRPPTPSPSPATAIGLDVSANGEPDQTIYQAFAVTSDGFDDLDQMALYYLTGDPVVDVLIEQPTRLGGRPGTLIVADVTSGGDVTSTVAAAMSLGDGETGYLLAAIFPPGAWESEQADFVRVVRSFRSEVPPGLETFPVTGQAS